MVARMMEQMQPSKVTVPSGSFTNRFSQVTLRGSPVSLGKRKSGTHTRELIVGLDCPVVGVDKSSSHHLSQSEIDGDNLCYQQVSQHASVIATAESLTGEVAP